MVGALSLALTVALGNLGFDPSIDGAREPPRGLGLTLALDRLDDTLGVMAEVRSPRFLDDRLVIAFAGGVGWFPETIRTENREVSLTPWSLFGAFRLRAELAARLAESPHRLYVALGPSLLLPGRNLANSDAGIGVHGGLGVELFAGDRFRRWPFALVIEAGATAHLLRADVGTGEAEVARSLATGFALSVGVRYYPFDG